MKGNVSLKKRGKAKKGYMRVRNSRKVYLPVYFMILVLIATLVVIKYKDLPLNNWALILAGLFIVFGIKSTELHRLNRLYEISPTSLTHTIGLVSRQVKSMDLSAISDMDIHQTFWQRLIGFGNVRVRLFSEASHTFRNINNPVKFCNFLENMMEKRRSQV